MGDIPEGLDQLDPSPLLGLWLASAEEVEVAGYDLPVLLAAYQKMIAHYQAKVYQTMAAIYDLTEKEVDIPPGEGFEWAAMEIACTLHLTRQSSESDLDFALSLRDRPQVAEALATGQLDLRRAKVLVYNTENLPIETAHQVIDRLMADAPHLTSGQLYARLRRLCMQANPKEAAQRYQNALADRRVVAEASPDGTAHIYGLDLAPDRVAELMAKINRLARSLKTADEERTLDQLQADVFLDLLEGNLLEGRDGRGTVDLHVDLATLAELDQHPGELAGYGPVIADIARQVAEQQQQAEWRWSVTDPHTGGVVCTGITRRRPTAAQRRQVEARQRTCIFPGCRRPALRCDLDHRRPWTEGGGTCPHNLEPLCRFHHRRRHRHHWAHQPLPDGDHLWISPLGRRYTTSGRSP